MRAPRAHGAATAAARTSRNVAFISIMLLLGALIRMVAPSWIPYTVFIFLVSMLMGIIAHSASVQESCPWHAFEYAGSDGKVSRAEWSLFLCEGCHPESYCLQKGHPLKSHDRTSGVHGAGRGG